MGQDKRADYGDVVGVCYRPPNRKKWMRIPAGSLDQPLSHRFLEDLNSPDICWRSNITKNKQSRSFLESIEDNVLTQVAEDPTRNGAAQILSNKQGRPCWRWEGWGQP